jgi:rhodanese-related sulfurtransferase
MKNICLKLLKGSLIGLLGFSSLQASDTIKYSTKNIMKHTKNNILKVLEDKGQKIKLISTKDLDLLIEKSKKNTEIIAYNKNCQKETIKGAKCLQSSTFKDIAKHIEVNNNKKNYIILCNSGKQSLIYASLFKLSGVETPNIIPASFKQYKKDGGKFIQKK